MKPLDGITIVSIEQALAAPLCTARLAEAGARVIKIERREGDFARGYDAAAAGQSSYFTWTNQGKESAVVDFTTPDGRNFLAALIAGADVFIQNLAPGAMERAGFGWQALRARHPRLITVDVTGYGEREAVRQLKAYDFLVQAESGMTAISGGENEMGRIGVSICDIGAGMTCHAAVLEALMLRARSGQGSALAVSLFDVAADWMTVPLIHAEHGRGAPARVGLRHPSMAPYGAFETADGALTLIAVQNEREWARFCNDVLVAPGLATDPRFGSNNDRVANRVALEAAIRAVTCTLTQAELRARLGTAGIAFGGVNSVADLGAHPALRRKRVVTNAGDALEVPASPIIWRETEHPPALAAAPAIGADTARIREEFMGESDEGSRK